MEEDVVTSEAPKRRNSAQWRKENIRRYVVKPALQEVLRVLADRRGIHPSQMVQALIVEEAGRVGVEIPAEETDEQEEEAVN